MKKSMMIGILVLLLTNLHAEFSFGEMFKNMKETAISMSKESKDSVVTMKDSTDMYDNDVKSLNEGNEHLSIEIKQLKEKLTLLKENNNQLKKKILELDTTNESMHTNIINRESEKNTFYQYVFFSLGMLILLFVSLIIFWFLSIKRCKQKREIDNNNSIKKES